MKTVKHLSTDLSNVKCHDEQCRHAYGEEVMERCSLLRQYLDPCRVKSVSRVACAKEEIYICLL